MDAPVKPNNGRMNLIQRELFPEQGSPFEPPKKCPGAPMKYRYKQARLATTDELASSPFKPNTQCPDAPRIPRHLSFVENYEEDQEDWMEDSYITENPEERPITWAPYIRKFNRRH